MHEFNENFLLKNKKILKITQVKVDDAVDLISYLNSIGGESDFLTFGLNEFPLSVDEEEVFIKKITESGRNMMLIGRVENQIVSQLFIDNLSNPRLQHIGDLSISVKKTFWGMSIGTHMLNSSILLSKKKNISKIQLYVRTDNDPAINLYKKHGFSIEGTISRAIKINEVYYENYLMGLNID